MFVELTVVLAHRMIAMALLAMRMAARRRYWLVFMSATDRPLGWLTCLAGVETALAVCGKASSHPPRLCTAWPGARFRWSRGPFALVEALDHTGGIALVCRAMGQASADRPGSRRFPGPF